MQLIRGFYFDSLTLLFWFNLFFEARAEILTKFRCFFLSIWRHQKCISKLTDLYPTISIDWGLNSLKERALKTILSDEECGGKNGGCIDSLRLMWMQSGLWSNVKSVLELLTILYKIWNGIFKSICLKVEARDRKGQSIHFRVYKI